MLKNLSLRLFSYLFRLLYCIVLTLFRASFIIIVYIFLSSLLCFNLINVRTYSFCVILLQGISVLRSIKQYVEGI